MSRLSLILLCWLAFLSSAALAGTYVLNDGSQLSGEIIWPANDAGVVVKTEGSTVPERMGWDKFSQDALRQLLSEAPSPRDKAFIEPLIEELPQEKAKRKEIVVKPVAKPSLPTQNIGFRALFSSPVGLLIFFILYGATIFAAYEVAIFRNQPKGLVCGLAAVPFLGVLSPIVFLSMPTNYEVEEAPATAAPATEPGTEGAASTASIPATGDVPEAVNPMAGPAGVHSSLKLAHEAPATAPVTLPAPIVFRRGEYSFNRRFFETKLAGFFRLVPGEAEKDMVVYIKAVRGEYTGKRIVRINANELYLQTFNGDATADEMLPFAEVLEVQIRHKDFA